MDTVIQSLLGIAVSLALSGCLVNTPPGVEMDFGAETDVETTKIVATTAELGERGVVTWRTTDQGDCDAFDDGVGNRALVIRRRCAGGGGGVGVG